MKRVLFVDHVHRILGGAEINLVELLAEAAPEHAWSCACPPHSPLAGSLRARGVTLYDYQLPEAVDQLRLVGRAATWRARWQGWRGLKKGGRTLQSVLTHAAPDVVISCTNKDHFCAVAACAPSGTPSIWWVNDVVSPDFFSPLARQLFRWQARRARHLITVSEFARRALLAEGIPSDRVTTIHNGIPLERYELGGRVRGSWRQQVGLPAVGPLAGVVGRFTPWKGQDFFLRLARAWVERHAHGHFVLIGQAFNEEQEFEAALRRSVRELGLGERVHFVPFQDPIADALADLDVLVHTSLRPEPFGRVLIEAMAAGVPVIAARAGGVPEIVTDGVDGWLAEPGDLTGYLAQLEKVFSAGTGADPLAAAARATVRRRFTVERVRAQFLQVLAERT